MLFLKENLKTIVTAVFLIVVGILLLVNPVVYAMMIIKITGILLGAAGVVEFIHYFTTEPELAARESGFYYGAVMISLGLFCLLGGKWMNDVFPVLAVVFGLFQIILGYRKLQNAIDALRMRMTMWWLFLITAGISIVFGFIIVLNPQMALINIWMFTGITMILEGIFDIAGMVLQRRVYPS